MLVRDEPRAVVVGAPAKLNLFLQVLGKRADGFHDLETLMVTVGIYDTLRFSAVSADSPDALTLTCVDARSRSRPGAGEALPLSSGPDNLVMRAAFMLREVTGTQQGANIELVKRIPLAAGLAGGSTDAAATLVGLNRLWKLNLPNAELRVLAARLGSDVPFFLSPVPTGAAVCRGRGEILEPVRLPQRLHFVIVRPQSGLSTAQVFRHCRAGSATGRVEDLVRHLQHGRLHAAARCLHNSLQEPAELLNVEVTQLKHAFGRMPFLGHLMSGSGTSYYGLCQHRRQAVALAARLRGTRLGDAFVAQSRS